jgi:redox-sensitive bicupin YhaK (pirin superfamily)
MSIRAVRTHVTATPTLEGAGVHLRRAFGFGDTEATDPFLLLDDFRNDVPDAYMRGFPWHPHRGIETITYVLAGTVDHADSLGNQGAIGAGDVQWMTAGRGIVHQEMPHGDPEGRMHGFQLWANLPQSRKMTAPRYQDVAAADVPVVTDDDGTSVRVICGEFWGRRGPVDGIAAEPQYLDITVPAGVERTLPVARSKNVFAYVFAGGGAFRDASAPRPVATDTVTEGGQFDDDRARYDTDVANRSLVLFDTGDEIRLRAGDDGLRFLLVSGAPIREPIAWHGPIVMNTQQELAHAFAQLRAGTFLDVR